MLFNVYTRDDLDMIVAPRFPVQPAHLADDPAIRHIGVAEVAFGSLSGALSASIANRGYGDAVGADLARLRASMWARPVPWQS